MAKRRSKAKQAVAFAIVLLVLVGILWNQRSDVIPPALVERLKLGVVQEPLCALLHLAVEKGFFAAEGLDVTVADKYSSGKLALQGMLDEEVELTACAEVPIVFNSFSRQDYKVIATIGSSNNEPKVIARRDRGIEKPADLKGKRIATQRASAVHFFLHLFMIKHSLTAGDVQLSFTEGEKLPEMFAAGEIDAFSMREPYISQASEKASTDNVIIFAEPGLYRKSYNLVSTNDLIREKPQVVEKALRALIRAESFASRQKGQAISIISRRLELEEAVLASVWPELDLRVALGQALLVELEDEAQWAIANELVESKEAPNYLNFIHLDALKAVKSKAVSIIH